MAGCSSPELWAFEKCDTACSLGGASGILTAHMPLGPFWICSMCTPGACDDEFDRACTEVSQHMGKGTGLVDGSRTQPRLVEQAGHLCMKKGSPGHPSNVGASLGRAYLPVDTPSIRVDQEPDANGTIPPSCSMSRRASRRGGD